MHRTERLYWILLAALLWLPLAATAAQDPDTPAEPRAKTAAEDPVEAMLSAARALKERQPELFGGTEAVLVTEVLPNTQGAAAGLMPGDVLVRYDETPLDSMDQLIELTVKAGEDRSVVLRFLRDGQVREASIHGGRIGVVIQDVAPTALDRMIELNQAGQQAWNQARYAEALKLYERGFALADRKGYRRAQGVFHGNIGVILDDLGRYRESLSHYEQALAIWREIGDRAGEATDLLNLGALHHKHGNTAEALSRYHAALAIQAEVGNPETLWRIWDNLRQLWSAQDRPGPAILAGKHTVNAIQAMRAASGELDKTLQKGFLEDKEHVYRSLADALIARDRIPEAEQVMTMLKEEELYDFIRRDVTNDVRATRADPTPAEQAWNARYERISAAVARIGNEYAALRRIDDPTEEEETRLKALEAELDQARTALIEIVGALETEFAAQGGTEAVALGKRQLDWLEVQQRQLQDLGHGAALISTVVTKDRLHLILTTPKVQLVRQSIIGVTALNALIGDLRAALTDRHSDLDEDLLPLARQLYGYLVDPIAEDLQRTESQTLMWSLDGALRYIPLAALHDGKRWLVERYPLVLYTAAARDNLGADSDAQWRVAGLGVSKQHQGLTSLDAVSGELEGIVQQHEEDPNRAGSGAKVESFGALAQKRGAKGVLATLWSVADASTGQLMQTLYRLRGNDAGLTKAEALRRAQLSLLHGSDPKRPCSPARGPVSTSGEGSRADRSSADPACRYAHPYYWAPFVLMGNWL